MPPQTPDALLLSLKRGELHPVYYLTGPEDVLKDEATRQIIEAALDPSLRDFNLDQRAAPQLDPDGLHSLLNTPPMMAERRVVLLREVEGLKKKPRVHAVLDAYLARPSPDTVLVMIQGSGEEKADAELARRSMAVD